MASSIDFSALGFSREEIRSLQQLIFKKTLAAPNFNALHTLYSDILIQREVGFVAGGGLVGKAAQGCNPVKQDWSVLTSKKLWDPKRWQVILEECAEDTRNSMVIYTQRPGVDANDLTGTEYMAMVVDLLSQAINKMIYRFVWFGDKNADNFSGGGIITNGVSPSYFNLIDGFWKQIVLAQPPGSRGHIPIAANTLPTRWQQIDGLTGQQAADTLNALHSRASVVLRQQPDLVGMCTQSFADGYLRYLTGKELESTFSNTLNGVQSFRYNGVNIIVMPIWDEMIELYENDGTKLNNPHRAILVPASNLAVGVPTADIISDVNVFYDEVKEINHMRAKDSIDALLLEDEMVVVAI